MKTRSTKLTQIAMAGAVITILGVLLFGHRTTTMALAPLTLPGSDARLWVELKPTHPFLAEYDRTLTVTRGASEARQALFPDTGGYGRLNIYVQSPEVTIVKGPFEELLVRVDTLRIEKLTTPFPAPGKYVAAFDKASEGTWRFIPASEENEVPVGGPQ
jgi:hypothetical protein